LTENGGELENLVKFPRYNRAFPRKPECFGDRKLGGTARKIVWFRSCTRQAERGRRRISL